MLCSESLHKVVLYCVQNSPPLVSLHLLARCLFNIHFNIILPFAPRSSKWSHRLRFLAVSIRTHVSPLSCVLHAVPILSPFENSGLVGCDTVLVVPDVSKDRSAFIRGRVVEPWRWRHYGFFETSGTGNAITLRNVKQDVNPQLQPCGDLKRLIAFVPSAAPFHRRYSTLVI